MSERDPTTLAGAKLYMSGAFGQYVPQQVAQSFETEAIHVENVRLGMYPALLEGPEASDYLDAWANLLDDGRVYHLPTDECWTLHQTEDGDVWLIPDPPYVELPTEWYMAGESDGVRYDIDIHGTAPDGKTVVYIATVGGEELTKEQVEANARLIAHAPWMRDSLKTAIERMKQMQQELREMNQILQKYDPDLEDQAAADDLVLNRYIDDDINECRAALAAATSEEPEK